MKTTYTKQALAEFAKGIFRDDKKSPSIYANEEGTFLNSDQYEERKKEGTHADFKFKFDNPAVKASANSGSAEMADLKTVNKELSEKIEDLEEDLEELDAKVSQRDAEITKLKDANVKVKSELTSAEGKIKTLEGEIAGLKKAAAAPAAGETKKNSGNNKKPQA